MEKGGYLIHVQTLEDFKSYLSAGDIPDDSICFIKDAKLIWTHGSYYAQSDIYVIEDLTFENILALADGWGDEMSYRFDTSKVMAAFDSGLPVFIRYSSDVTVSDTAGMFAVDGYYEDLLYLRITDDQGIVYKIETQREAVDITADNISKDIYAERDRLKTINGQSIVGTGDITISTAYPMRTGSGGTVSITLNPNEMIVFGVCVSLQVTSFNAGDSSVVNEYVFQFTSGSTATTLTLPSSVKWANGEPPVIEANMIYQISVLNDCAAVLAFSNS